MDINLLHYSLFNLVSVWLVHLACGYLVVRYNIRVNYTRKVCHFTLFGLHYWGLILFPHRRDLVTSFLSAGMAILFLLFFVEKIRGRVPTMSLAFKAVDRPEDRPFTLDWLILQILLMYAVLIPLTQLFKINGVAELFWIPVIISCFGDGLAEPVGVRFGRHSYTTKALFSEKTYIRTLEGSACVLFSAVVSILIYQSHFSSQQFTVLILALPVIATLAEGMSPHTLDQPLILLSTGGFVYLVKVGL